ncbi:MAG: ABC transporter permease [Lachnospiraceae bacterium]|nr:ABC transporter permease [Lachnospiraceae bacterium]
MNIFNKVTRRSLLKNRVRTIVTIIGILLSAAMITAVTTSISSLQNYAVNCCIYQEGDWHGSFVNLPAEKKDKLEKEKGLGRITFAQNIGYAEIESSNDYKPYLYVLGADKNFADQMPVHLISGRMPENSSEILLPEHYVSNAGITCTEGDRLTLKLGDRYTKDTQLVSFEAFQMNENGTKAEKLKIRETRSYTVTGFYERPAFENYEAPGYTAITVWDDDHPVPALSAYFRMQKAKDVFAFVDNSPYGKSTYNRSLLMYEGESAYSTFYTTLFSMGVILIVLILFGSVSLIYNAFSISVSERTKQFGLLSSIGATKRQLRKMVLMEAVYVSLIGIPLGIISGILGIGVTFYLIGDKFYAFYGMKEVPLTLSLTWQAVAAAAVIAFITVLISAWIPSRRATRVTAIQAIRQAEDVSIRSKDVKTSPLTIKLFGLEGGLAKKHFKRNRRRYRATVCSLFMSVVLFISASSYCSYLTDMVTGVFEDYDYDIRCDWKQYERSLGNQMKTSVSMEKAAQTLAKTEGVTQYSYVKGLGMELVLPFSMIPDDTGKRLFGTEEAFKEQAELSKQDGTGGYHTWLTIYGVDSAAYDRYLKEMGLKRELYYDTEKPLGILMGFEKEFNTASQRYEKIRLISEEINKLPVTLFNSEKWDAFTNSVQARGLSSEELEEKKAEFSQSAELEIGAFAETLPFGLNRSTGGISLVYPMKQFNSLFHKQQNTSAEIFFKTTNHATVFEKLKETAKTLKLPADVLMDVYETSESDRNLVMILKVFAYGFIVLISLISVANVFNTISTNILLRRREFAMLKSVGMTAKGFNRMMSYECILYGGKSLMYGLPVSFLITWLIFKSVSSGYDAFFSIPWGPVAIAVLSVFAVVAATMVYGMKKVKKDNLIDALKNENY